MVNLVWAVIALALLKILERNIENNRRSFEEDEFQQGLSFFFNLD
jgi:hypothetical protein